MSHAEIPLSNGSIAILDRDDLPLIEGKKLFGRESKPSYQYVGVWIAGKVKYLHRLVLNAPDDVMVDHINGDGLDNRRSNLRLCTRSQNAVNVRGRRNRVHGTWRLPGGKFASRIRVEGEAKFLGTFDTEVEAAYFYNVAAKEWHGRFAALNSIDIAALRAAISRRLEATAAEAAALNKILGDINV